jgi:hypothetical protein
MEIVKMAEGRLRLKDGRNLQANSTLAFRCEA